MKNFLTFASSLFILGAACLSGCKCDSCSAAGSKGHAEHSEHSASAKCAVCAGACKDASCKTCACK